MKVCKERKNEFIRRKEIGTNNKSNNFLKEVKAASTDCFFLSCSTPCFLQITFSILPLLSKWFIGLLSKCLPLQRWNNLLKKHYYLKNKNINRFLVCYKMIKSNRWLLLAYEWKRVIDCGSSSMDVLKLNWNLRSHISLKQKCILSININLL